MEKYHTQLSALTVLTALRRTATHRALTQNTEGLLVKFAPLFNVCVLPAPICTAEAPEFPSCVLRVLP